MKKLLASQKVLTLFNQFKNHPFIFVEPGGNFGDELIWKGAYKLAKQAKLNYKIYDHNTFMNMPIKNDDVIYIFGSGGFNSIWTGTPFQELRKAVTRTGGITIVGPSTVSEEIDFLRENFSILNTCSTDNKIYFFAREMKSYEIFKKLLPSWIELDHDHDTAFNLETQDIYSHPLARKYNYYAIREDRELQNFKKFNPFILWEDPTKLAKTFDDWVKIHANARKIITNRTHSTILASILGKKVTMLPNSYHKNRSIWEYSLSSQGVLWADKIHTNPAITQLLKTKLYPKICYSYKLRQFIRAINGFSTNI